MVKICVRFQSPTAALELARFRNTVEKESVSSVAECQVSSDIYVGSDTFELHISITHCTTRTTR